MSNVIEPWGITQEQFESAVRLLESAAFNTATKFGFLSAHITEGGWCVHVFKDREVGCRAATLIDGILHVNEEHFPGELDPELHDVLKEEDHE